MRRITLKALCAAVAFVFVCLILLNNRVLNSLNDSGFDSMNKTPGPQAGINFQNIKNSPNDADIALESAFEDTLQNDHAAALEIEVKPQHHAEKAINVEEKSPTHDQDRHAVSFDNNDKILQQEVLAEGFWRNLFEIFDKHVLDLTKEQLEEGVVYMPFSETDPIGTSKEDLKARAKISSEFLHQLQKQHKQILQELPLTISTSTYNAGSSGTVIVGGGRYSWLAHLGILAMRDRGCKLPVEVVIPTRELFESDKEWCTEQLPQLNAKCIVLNEKLGPDVERSWGHRIMGYQFKVLAVLVLSFEHVLLLDSDNLLLQNPQRLFDSDLYRDYGMITWPDFWFRTFSPDYYEQLDIKVDETKRVRFHLFPLEPHPDDRPLLPEELSKVPFHDFAGAVPDLSTESGQMLVNKKTHGDVLLLALYYNIYGPNVFYKLFSLGVAGEGDNDTFVAAATVLNRPYYQVHSQIRPLGYTEPGNSFHIAGMRQADPLEDFNLFLEKIVVPLKHQPRPQIEQIEHIETVYKENFNKDSTMRSFAIHCNWPKLDPIHIPLEPVYDREQNKLRSRMFDKFTLLEMKARDNILEPNFIDFELFMWKRMFEMACGPQKIGFGYTKGTDMLWACEFIDNQVKWLTETTTANPGRNMIIERV